MAGEVANVLAAAVRQRGWASIALAGGSTPVGVYRRLAASHRGDVAWRAVHFYWGDERFVAYDDPRSNYRMTRESLLDALPVTPEHVHPMPTSVAPARAVTDYEQTLRSRFATEWPTFDLVLLGVGEDGHTASLFPRSAALGETSRWVTATVAPVEPRQRLTLTVPALTHAATVFVLAVGRSKANAVRCALGGEPDPGCPASFIRTTRGRLAWWLDEAAAARVSASS
jgi:6-phosphogluconolactonase